MDQAFTQPASLYIYSDRIVWGSDSYTGGETIRPACALLIGTRRPLEITVAGKVLQSRALLIAPHVGRALVAQRAGFYSLTLDPAHPSSRFLREQVLAGRDLLDLGAQYNRAVAQAVRPVIDGETDCVQARTASQRLLTHFFGKDIGGAPVDARVALAAAWLRRQLPPRANMQQLGRLCQLSAGRLTHLFTQELGVSIRSYLRWSKMCRAAELLGGTQSVTEIAAEIGFADAAHFTRVLRTYYSASPSLVLNRERVRVHSCSGSDEPDDKYGDKNMLPHGEGRFEIDSDEGFIRTPRPRQGSR